MGLLAVEAGMQGRPEGERGRMEGRTRWNKLTEHKYRKNLLIHQINASVISVCFSRLRILRFECWSRNMWMYDPYIHMVYTIYTLSIPNSPAKKQRTNKIKYRKAFAILSSIQKKMFGVKLIFRQRLGSMVYQVWIFNCLQNNL